MTDDYTRRYLRFQATPRAMAAMEVDYPDGSSTGAHSHPRDQLLYAIEGVMIVQSPSGIWVVPPNRAAWLVAGVEHEVRMCGDVKIRTIFVDPALLPDLPRESCVIDISPLLRELVVAAMVIPLDYAVDSRDGRLMRLLLDELQGRAVLPLHLPLPSDPRLRRICEGLTRDPGDTTTAGGWAARLGVTAKTVHRLFQRETGLSFGRWRQQARLLQALQRLARGDRVIDVALDCGYASQSAFTAMFRRHFGVPPGAFYR